MKDQLIVYQHALQSAVESTTRSPPPFAGTEHGASLVHLNGRERHRVAVVAQDVLQSAQQGSFPVGAGAVSEEQALL